ncbi:hypothetical protein [Achromobacter spanius]|uniref:hypothetical protein n=1 Tax=Achromobacter spanius TaxID=217203 RepID=UPI0038283AA0
MRRHLRHAISIALLTSLRAFIAPTHAQAPSTPKSNYAKQNQDLKATVYLYVGAYEALRKGDRRYNQTVDMVADNRALEAALLSRKYPGLKLKSAVLNDEDHLTVAPRGFTQGLKYLLPVR